MYNLFGSLKKFNQITDGRNNLAKYADRFGGSLNNLTQHHNSSKDLQTLTSESIDTVKYLLQKAIELHLPIPNKELNFILTHNDDHTRNNLIKRKAVISPINVPKDSSIFLPIDLLTDPRNTFRLKCPLDEEFHKIITKGDINFQQFKLVNVATYLFHEIGHTMLDSIIFNTNIHNTYSTGDKLKRNFQYEKWADNLSESFADIYSLNLIDSIFKSTKLNNIIRGVLLESRKLTTETLNSNLEDKHKMFAHDVSHILNNTNMRYASPKDIPSECLMLAKNNANSALKLHNKTYNDMCSEENIDLFNRTIDNIYSNLKTNIVKNNIINIRNNLPSNNHLNKIKIFY